MSIRFCDECGNMLIPLENNTTKKLKYYCSNCIIFQNEKENTQQNNIVYRNEVKLGQTKEIINKSLINDPTYARTLDLECPKCHFKEAICFQNQNINDAGMKFIYLCCNKNYENTGEPCGNYWDKKGKEEDKANK